MGLFNKFPIDVVIFEERGGEGQYLKILDKGRRIQKKDTGEYYYELQKKKTKTPPVPYDTIYLGRRGNTTTQTVYMYSMTPFTFVPLKFDNAFAQGLANGEISKAQAMELIPEALQKSFRGKDAKVDVNIDDKWLYWAAQQLKQNVYRSQYKSTLEKLLPIAMVAVTGIVIGIILYMTIGQMEVLTANNQAVGQQLVVIAERLESTARILTNTPAPIPPPF